MKYFTYKLDSLLLNVFSVILLIFMVIITYLITSDLSFITEMNWFSFLMLFGWMIIHELLHGIGFISLGKVNSKSVVFGVEIEKGIFYCMCKEKVSKSNVLIALLFPLFLIGIITYIIGIIFNNDLLIFLSVFNIAGAIGDIVMTIDIMLMPKDIMYLDLDDTIGFTILSDKDISVNKYFLINLMKKGKYTDKLIASDYTKFKISKFSYYFFIIFIILFVLFIL